VSLVTQIVSEVLGALQSLTTAIASLPHKWAITLVVLGVYMWTRRMWHTPPPTGEILQSETALHRHQLAEALRNAGFFGATTFLVLVWNTPWITWPFVLVQGAIFMHQLLIGIMGTALLVRSDVQGEQWLPGGWTTVTLKWADDLIYGFYVLLAVVSLSA
jgi:hypothetical protein